MVTETKHCGNCGSPIGKLETAHAYKGHTVCDDCNRRLAPDQIGPESVVSDLDLIAEINQRHAPLESGGVPGVINYKSRSLKSVQRVRIETRSHGAKAIGAVVAICGTLLACAGMWLAETSREMGQPLTGMGIAAALAGLLIFAAGRAMDA